MVPFEKQTLTVIRQKQIGSHFEEIAEMPAAIVLPNRRINGLQGRDRGVGMGNKLHALP